MRIWFGLIGLECRLSAWDFDWCIETAGDRFGGEFDTLDSQEVEYLFKRILGILVTFACS